MDKSAKVQFKTGPEYIQKVGKNLTSIVQSLPERIQKEIDSIFFTKSSHLGGGFANLLWATLNCSIPPKPHELLSKYNGILPIYRTAISMFFIGATMLRLNAVISQTFGVEANIPVYTFWDF